MRNVFLLLFFCSVLLTACATTQETAKKAASVQDAQEQNAIGLFYLHGMNGYPKNPQKASEYFAASAQQGYAKAQYNLGVNYERGIGVAQNPVTAAEWYQKAAEQGHAMAQHNLGVFYQRGIGVPQDFSQANSWYHKAAAQGYAPAQFNLGTAYWMGYGVEKNSDKAIYWFQKADAQGFEPARKMVKLFYENAQRRSVDDPKAVQDVISSMKRFDCQDC